MILSRVLYIGQYLEIAGALYLAAKFWYQERSKRSISSFAEARCLETFCMVGIVCAREPVPNVRLGQPTFCCCRLGATSRCYFVFRLSLAVQTFF